jgi:hypothetical protein
MQPKACEFAKLAEALGIEFSQKDCDKTIFMRHQVSSTFSFPRHSFE